MYDRMPKYDEVLKEYQNRLAEQFRELKVVIETGLVHAYAEIQALRRFNLNRAAKILDPVARNFDLITKAKLFDAAERGEKITCDVVERLLDVQPSPAILDRAKEMLVDIFIHRHCDIEWSAMADDSDQNYDELVLDPVFFNVVPNRVFFVTYSNWFLRSRGELYRHQEYLTVHEDRMKVLDMGDDDITFGGLPLVYIPCC
ncbi:hypothetical protein [Thalassoroseus pseudoceratinae]|uniref:hypothetical protein n=1 Tax=Thalassoroseus pseudoceratinae TaxID=2713176 RepID=UPI001421AB5A|nr:hypothetical protein [Thalassoroseus pseudoceratinae]